MPLTAQSICLEEIFRGAVLPALPGSAVALLRVTHQPDPEPLDVARPIETDPGLTGQVLRFVNSSYFGFPQEIRNVRQAVMLVGPRTISNFALWNAVVSVIPHPKFAPFDMTALWQDSLRRALFARQLAERLELENSEDVFTGALLQDMAIPLLLKQLPKQYELLAGRRAKEGRRLSCLEQEMFGWDHAEAAVRLAQHWNLPQDSAFLDLIADHT